MFNFIKKGTEFNKLAKVFGGMNTMLNDLTPRVKNSYRHNDFKEEIFVLAYIARKGVIDRMEEYNWTMNSKIMVPEINRGLLPISMVYSQTVEKLITLADEIGMSEGVINILDKGEAFYTLEKHLPAQVIKDI